MSHPLVQELVIYFVLRRIDRKDESLSKLKIPSELKKNEIDSKHAGMARDLGHVIQPNLDRACNPSTI